MGSNSAKSLRDGIKELSPPWLADGNAEKYLYNIGLAGDVLLEKMSQAMKAHMPGQGDASALPYLGDDRVMSQGPNESNTAFATRLTGAFDAWQRAGSRRSILAQVLGYLANPANVASTQVPVAAMVNANGTVASWDVFYSGNDTSRPPHHARISPTNWNWDGTSSWWQVFLVLYFQLVTSSTTGTAATLSAPSSGFVTVTGLTGMTSASVGMFLVITGAANSANNGTFQIASYISAVSVTIANPSGVGADANNGSISWTLGSYPAVGPAPAFGTPGVTIGGNPSTSIGLSVSSSYMQGVRSLVRLWKDASTFVPWIVVTFAGGNGGSSGEFSPNTTSGVGNPDGTWGTWGKTVSGVSVPARSTGIALGRFDCFCDGTGIYQSAWVPS